MYYYQPTVPNCYKECRRLLSKFARVGICCGILETQTDPPAEWQPAAAACGKARSRYTCALCRYSDQPSFNQETRKG